MAWLDVLSIFGARNTNTGVNEQVDKTDDARNALHVQTELLQPTTPFDTQSVSGTITVDAGTDLNTSLLALESGGNLAAVSASLAKESGTWGYNAGTSGTLALTGGKRVLQITAIAQQVAASFTINGGDTITLPYGATDKASSAITIEPKGNLTDPTIIFSATVGWFVEWVT